MALQESRRNLIGLQAAHKALAESIKREEMQARPQGVMTRTRTTGRMVNKPGIRVAESACS